MAARRGGAAGALVALPISFSVHPAELVCAVDTPVLCAKVTFERVECHFGAQTRRADCTKNMSNYGVAARNLRNRAHNHIYRRVAGKMGLRLPGLDGEKQAWTPFGFSTLVRCSP